MRKLFILMAVIFCSALSAQNSKVKTLTIEPQAEPSVGLGKIYFGLDGKMYLYDGTAWNYQILNNDAQFIANTAKIGITPSQAADIITNNAKVGITPTQAADIVTNNAKVGITPTQASDITSNNAKISNATHTGDVTGSTALTIANNSVTSAKIVDGTILPADLANQSYGLLGYSQVGTATTYGIATVLDNILGQSNITPAAPSSSSDLLLTRESAIPTNTKLSSIQQIADKMSIGSAQIADGSIATADLADVSITNAKLADNSVSGGNIIDGSIGNADLAANTVSGTNIIDGSIALADLSATGVASASTYLRGDNTWATVAAGGGTPDDNTVTSAKIVDGAIATIDLADLSITNDKVALSAITNDKIANETITGAKIQDASIGLADLSATGIKDVTTVLHGDGVFRAVSGSTNNDALTEQALAGNYTLVAGDFTSGRKVIYNNTANDYQVTVPDVATVGQKIIFSQYGTGKIQVGMGSGVTGTSFQTVDNTSNLTMYKSVVGYRPVGAYDPYTPVPANLYTLSNAASPTNEANNATGFVNDITVSFSSSATAPQDGLYSVVMEHTGLDNTSVRGTTSFTSDGVSQYSIKVFVKEMIGTNWSWSINSGEGWTASQTVNITAVGEWVEYEIIATANATNCLIRFNGTSSSDTGNQLGIDNIRIVKL